MTFLEAIKTGRPMRRHADWTAGWLWLGEERHLTCRLPRWRHLDTGEVRGLGREDYEATDWTVLE